ncbi:unnamed protein product, partial [marine sediment metagenome]
DFDAQDATYGRHSHGLVPYIAVTPKAMVQNRGKTAESFYVTATSTGYSSTKLVSGLASGEGVIVEFDPFTPGTNGSYTLTVTANLTGDQNTNNDDFSINLTCSYTDTLQCDGGDWNVQYTDAWAGLGNIFYTRPSVYAQGIAGRYWPHNKRRSKYSGVFIGHMDL